jgi:hypothetical protein
MAEAKEISEILSYIQQREETLSRYSDKLRQSLAQISQVFGDADYCQRCGKWKGHHGTKELRQTWGACERFEPQISVSIDVIDDMPFKVEEEQDEYALNTKYYLAIIKHRLGYVETFDNDRFTPKTLAYFSNAPRELLKALVKSGRLIPFLQKVADVLAEKGEEYREVSEVAEKLAQAIP